MKTKEKIDKDLKWVVGSEFKASQDSRGNVTISGYASTADLDRDNEIISPEAFRRTLSEFMKNPLMFYGHEIGGMFSPTGKPIGKFIKAEIRDSGLWVEGIIHKLTEQAREI